MKELSQYQICRKEILKKRAEIEAIEALCEHITADPTSERVQASGNKDRLGELASRKADLINELMDAINKALDSMLEIEDMIDRVDDEDSKIILQQRYIEGMKWDDIAEANHYSRSTVLEKSKKAREQMKVRTQSDGHL